MRWSHCTIRPSIRCRVLYSKRQASRRRLRNDGGLMMCMVATKTCCLDCVLCCVLFGVWVYGLGIGGHVEHQAQAYKHTYTHTETRTKRAARGYFVVHTVCSNVCLLSIRTISLPLMCDGRESSRVRARRVNCNPAGYGWSVGLPRAAESALRKQPSSRTNSYAVGSDLGPARANLFGLVQGEMQMPFYPPLSITICV